MAKNIIIAISLLLNAVGPPAGYIYTSYMYSNAYILPARTEETRQCLENGMRWSCLHVGLTDFQRTYPSVLLLTIGGENIADMSGQLNLKETETKSEKQSLLGIIKRLLMGLSGAGVL